MKPRWCRNLSEQEKKELKANYLSAHETRQKLVEMLEEDINKSLARMRDAFKDNVSNLTEFYTDELATQRTLLDVINLIRD